MISVKISFVVKKPVHLVCKRISEIVNYPRWAPGENQYFLKKKSRSEAPFGSGATHADELEWQDKAKDKLVPSPPLSHVEFQQKTWLGRKVFTAVTEYGLKGVQSSTEIEHRFNATLFGKFRLLEPVFSILLRSNRERTCRAIKQALERQ